MKNYFRWFMVVLMLSSTAWAGLVSAGDPASPTGTQAKSHKKRKKNPLNPPLSKGGQGGFSACATQGAGLNPAISGLAPGQVANGDPYGLPLQPMVVGARQALNVALPGNPAAANALDQAVLGLASADTQALAPLVNSQKVPASGPTTLHDWFHQRLADHSSTWPMEFSAGIQMLNADVVPSLALRIKRQNPPLSPFDKGGSKGDFSPWSFELGGAIPTSPSGGIQNAEQTVDTTQYNAQVLSFYELHAAGVYALPHGSQNWAAPEVGLGLSMVHVHNRVQSLTPGTEVYDGQTYAIENMQTTTQDRISWSPLVRLGVTLFPERLLSLRLDAAYVGYANTVNDFGTQMDLRFSGLMYRVLLAVRL